MTSAKTKKEKIFHPQSRKAGQLVRASLRKDKLRSLVSKRGLKHHSLADGYRFYHQCVPDEGVLALEELHSIVRDTWLTRFGVELEAEHATRRKGRPKSTSQIKLEELKLRESEEYRTGLEVVDLTHGPTVELFKKWDQKEIAYVEQLRFIRISSTDPSVAVVSRPGKHPSLLVETDVQMRDIS
ncbi:hypothetical protein M378DRAFT_157658 [Amanita muscaria Koide BX008]|uniref:Translation machinery-associated protein 16 n=1 Tax=Amanita muscaria (strain Koide BX008) TaxID=946122 RepID=A0A0C2XJY7_AMAMK|nr:hypothetical protein M378DRAFT_157658 [Amanita muscaria Koide BX008]